jgi:hypothetical protein
MIGHCFGKDMDFTAARPAIGMGQYLKICRVKLLLPTK